MSEFDMFHQVADGRQGLYRIVFHVRSLQRFLEHTTFFVQPLSSV